MARAESPETEASWEKISELLLVPPEHRDAEAIARLLVPIANEMAYHMSNRSAGNAHSPLIDHAECFSNSLFQFQKIIEKKVFTPKDNIRGFLIGVMFNTYRNTRDKELGIKRPAKISLDNGDEDTRKLIDQLSSDTPTPDRVCVDNSISASDFMKWAKSFLTKNEHRVLRTEIFSNTNEGKDNAKKLGLNHGSYRTHIYTARKTIQAIPGAKKFLLESGEPPSAIIKTSERVRKRNAAAQQGDEINSSNTQLIR